MALEIIFLVLRIGLGALFVFAGAIKIWNFDKGISATPAFYQDIVNYHLQETDLIRAVAGHFSNPGTLSDIFMLFAIYLPWLEVVIGIALLLRYATAGAATIVTVLMVLFIAALASAWSRNLDISCGCFGHDNATADLPRLLARDGALLLVSAALLWHSTRKLARV